MKKLLLLTLLTILAFSVKAQDYQPHYAILEKSALLTYDSILFFHPGDLEYVGNDIGPYMNTHYIFGVAEEMRCYNCPVIESVRNDELKRVALVWFTMDSVYMARNISSRDVTLNLLNFKLRKNKKTYEKRRIKERWPD